jgi:hypothetical protein
MLGDLGTDICKSFALERVEAVEEGKILPNEDALGVAGAHQFVGGIGASRPDA